MNSSSDWIASSFSQPTNLPGLSEALVIQKRPWAFDSILEAGGRNDKVRNAVGKEPYGMLNETEVIYELLNAFLSTPCKVLAYSLPILFGHSETFK